MWSNKDLAFILYNNRSVHGVVKNFINTSIDPYKLNKIEFILEKHKNRIVKDKRMVEIKKKELNLEGQDIIIKPSDLESLTQLILDNVGNFNDDEYQFLINRGIGDETIIKWSILGLSSIKKRKDLEIIGATCHPVLNTILNDGIETGGIIIPLIKNGKLINCAIRKINSSKSLKYSLACPDVPVWGLDNLENSEEIWITEGLFDMMALSKLGKKVISCSSAMWTGLQLYEVLERNPSKINIFSDNDQVGLRTSAILKYFFIEHGIPCKIFVSSFAKDAAEHIFEKDKYLSDLLEIESIEQLLETKFDDSFDFLKYLKNRKY